MGRALRTQMLAVDTLAQRLQISHPGAKLAQHAQRLDDLELRMRLALRAAVSPNSSGWKPSARGCGVRIRGIDSKRCAPMPRHCASVW